MLSERDKALLFYNPQLIASAEKAQAEQERKQAADNARFMGMTTEQIEQEIRARAEACMDEKKNNGYSWFNAFGNREENRGTCTAYARESLKDALSAAQQRDAKTKFTFDDAAAAQARKGTSNETLYLVAGVALAALALYLLLG